MQVESSKRLQDALDAITAIERFLENQFQDDFLRSDILQAAVERKFEILGEALKKAADADASIEMLVPDLRQIISTRNRIIHVYDAVDHLLLWDVTQTQLPGLKARLLQILADASGQNDHPSRHDLSPSPNRDAHRS